MPKEGMRIIPTEEATADTHDQLAREQSEYLDRSKVQRVVNAFRRISIALAHSEIDR